MDLVHILALLVGVAGMLAHFWKKKLKEPSFPALKKYIVGHLPYTIAALAATLAGSYGLAPEVLDFSNIGATIAAWTPVFLVGFSVDSLINKAVAES